MKTPLPMRTPTRTARGLRRGLRRGLALPLLAVLLGGCGIRATQVPTDFGPAPTRIHCALTDDGLSPQSTPGIPVQVFLVCSSQLVTLDRSVRIPDGTAEAERRVLVAQGLVDELSQNPSAAETQAGYTTAVPKDLRVSGPSPKDPENTFRLTKPPTSLSSYALAQIICTFADSEATAADDGSVILGGPGTGNLRRYTCTTELRDAPGEERPESTAVGA
ncbi:hypothetical protein OK074_6012 [Actinobacteria bacterium OK074]|nr:hypothetical protein OK074_6012 [Actinobacteria bacterium OK074]